MENFWSFWAKGWLSEALMIFAPRLRLAVAHLGSPRLGGLERGKQAWSFLLAQFSPLSLISCVNRAFFRRHHIARVGFAGHDNRSCLFGTSCYFTPFRCINPKFGRLPRGKRAFSLLIGDDKKKLQIRRFGILGAS